MRRSNYGSQYKVARSNAAKGNCLGSLERTAEAEGLRK